MPGWMKAFFAFASVIAGSVLIAVNAWKPYYLSEWIGAIAGVVFLAGGVTYFWTRSKFYKG
jgi:general stress protein CsbA